ncbi:MAG: helix-turn-helix domain-containing protein [Calditrichia bacterium]
MIDKMEVGGRIKRIMKQAQMNQVDLAAYLGISQPAVSQYLQGRIAPAEVLLNIARLGNTTTEWILTGNPATSSPSRVKEAQADYQAHPLFLAWSRLPSAIQRDLLALIRHLAEKQGAGSRE